jgi:hypothetical protein
MPFYEYICKSTLCMPDAVSKEYLMSEGDSTPTCDICKATMAKLVSAPRGFVRGSNNPVKQ